MRLTFHYEDAYEDADLAGTAPVLLHLASQDDQGYWRVWPQATVDAAQHTITVEAPHFSDWSAIAGARLFAEATTVETGKTTALHVRDCRMAEPDSSLVVSLLYECKDAGVYGYECKDAGVYGGKATNWSVNGTEGGTNADNEQLTLGHAGQFTATLVKLSEGPGGVSWIGTVSGTASMNDREVVPYPPNPPLVTTLAGSGAPANDAAAPEELAHVYLNLNLDECTYNTGLVTWVRATETDPDGTPYVSDRHVGSVRTADRPITSLTASSFTGSGDVLAHSDEWGNDNDGDAYFPGGLGDRLYGRAYRAEGQAGTAHVSWSFAPVR